MEKLPFSVRLAEKKIFDINVKKSFFLDNTPSHQVENQFIYRRSKKRGGTGSAIAA